MKKKIKIIISWLLVILWMFVIFMFSNMPGEESDSKSKGTINTVVEVVVAIADKLEIIDEKPTSFTIEQFVEKINIPLRKFMHAFIYLVLGVLVFNALKVSNVENKKIVLIAFLICFIYACTDEYHQTLIAKRSGELRDVLIDTTGSIIGITSYYLIAKKITKKN